MGSLPAHPHLLAAGHVLAAGSSGPSPLWYATRATGVVALVLLTATVALGVAGTTRLSTQSLPRLVRSGLHRNLSLLAVLFVVLHVLTSVLDPYAGISLVSAVIPFSSAYRPLWLGLGAVAFDMILALVLTSLLRARMPYRQWRAVHWLGYACWPVALWHGLGTGTDSRLSLLLLLDAACILVVAIAAVLRLRHSPPGPGRLAGLLGTAALVLATVVFVAAGPLQPGWSKRAGTPASMLHSAHPASAGPASQAGASR